MATISENLIKLNQVKNDIKLAIKEKNQDLTDIPFTQYADKIKSIDTGGFFDVYLQIEEPSNKNGLWIQDENNNDNLFFINSSRFSEIPFYSCGGCRVLAGAEIFLFDGLENGYKNIHEAYKYNLITDNYIQITKCSSILVEAHAVSIGNSIYILGGKSSSTNLYRYDISTNNYTKLANIPFSFNGQVVIQGTNIFLFGNDFTANRTNAYRYDISTNNYTKLTNVPIEFYNGGCTIVNNNVYLFHATSNYKYDISTNNYTQIAFLVDMRGTNAISMGKEIYLVGGNYSAHSISVHKYNVETNSYIELPKLPIYASTNTVFSFGKEIYVVGTPGKPTGIWKYLYNNSKNGIYVELDSSGKTIAVTKVQDNIVTNLKAYQGDGSKYVLID